LFFLYSKPFKKIEPHNFLTGVNTLAFGHYRITTQVIDTTPASRSGDDIVLSAAEAATLVRRGRPTAMCMPIGVDPVSEVQQIHSDRAADLRVRIAHARANKQVHSDPYERKLNAPLVSALINGVIFGRRHYGFDNDFDADEIDGMYETAREMFHNCGGTRDEVFEQMLTLVGSMREMKLHPQLQFDENEESEADGEVIEYE